MFDLLHSSIEDNNEFQDLNSIIQWMESRKTNNYFEVQEVPFTLLNKWYFEEKTRNLRHSSGKFFSIEGIHVETLSGSIKSWDQPIIVQPEIGILGIITKVIGKTRYFLMQAKMEPGNINTIQVSPTVQATKSNFTQVHKGILPKYLEYFIDSTKSNVLIDKLLTEQGGRFYRKKNRNIIVEVYEDIPVYEDFVWLTISQLKRALRIDNLINMDSRSVLSTIPFLSTDPKIGYLNRLPGFIKSNSHALDLLSSAVTESTINPNSERKRWISEMKAKLRMNVEMIPLACVKKWEITESRIAHESGSFFEVIAVEVHAGNREVVSWTQPLLKERNIGLIGFLVKKINGVLHFLIQAKPEPGCFDVLDIAPTVSCSDYKNVLKSDSKPHFIEYFDNPDRNNILYSGIQSEEGGRFFGFQNLNIIIQIKADDLIDLPPQYKWVTLSQIMDMLYEGYLNIEARSLVSALSLVL